MHRHFQLVTIQLRLILFTIMKNPKIDLTIKTLSKNFRHRTHWPRPLKESIFKKEWVTLIETISFRSKTILKERMSLSLTHNSMVLSINMLEAMVI